MKHKLKATLAALATMAVVAAIFALPALAQSGVDEAWTNDMNHTSYWEARFGGECDKTENHSGSIGTASQAVVKDGNRVRVYDPAPTQVLGPVNPANGNHFDPPHSWVMTCMQTSSTSSTSSSSTSSTTSTTSTSLVTTTTLGTTTTTVVDSSTSTTTPKTTPTSTATPTTPTPEAPTELPRTGFSLIVWGVIALVGLLSGGAMARKYRP